MSGGMAFMAQATAALLAHAPVSPLPGRTIRNARSMPAMATSEVRPLSRRLTGLAIAGSFAMPWAWARASRLLIPLAVCCQVSLALAQDGSCPLRPQTHAVANGAWRLVSEADLICVYTRKSQASGVHEILAVATIAASPAELRGVISDYARYPEFMPYVEVSEVLKREGNTAWVFQQLSLPFPISDRYYTIRVVGGPGPASGNGARISWSLARDTESSNRGEGVPMLVNDGFWDLHPLEGGASTRVTYFIHTNPGGSLPSFAVNMANTVAVPRVMESLRARVLAGSIASESVP